MAGKIPTVTKARENLSGLERQHAEIERELEKARVGLGVAEHTLGEASYAHAGEPDHSEIMSASTAVANLRDRVHQLESALRVSALRQIEAGRAVGEAEKEAAAARLQEVLAEGTRLSRELQPQIDALMDFVRRILALDGEAKELAAKAGVRLADPYKPRHISDVLRREISDRFLLDPTQARAGRIVAEARAALTEPWTVR